MEISGVSSAYPLRKEPTENIWKDNQLSLCSVNHHRQLSARHGQGQGQWAGKSFMSPPAKLREGGLTKLLPTAVGGEHFGIQWLVCEVFEFLKAPPRVTRIPQAGGEKRVRKQESKFNSIVPTDGATAIFTIGNIGLTHSFRRRFPASLVTVGVSSISKTRTNPFPPTRAVGSLHVSVPGFYDRSGVIFSTGWQIHKHVFVMFIVPGLRFHCGE